MFDNGIKATGATSVIMTGTWRDSKVAVKVFSEEYTSQPGFQEKFEREVCSIRGRGSYMIVMFKLVMLISFLNQSFWLLFLMSNKEKKMIISFLAFPPWSCSFQKEYGIASPFFTIALHFHCYAGKFTEKKRTVPFRIVRVNFLNFRICFVVACIAENVKGDPCVSSCGFCFAARLFRIAVISMHAISHRVHHFR